MNEIYYTAVHATSLPLLCIQVNEKIKEGYTPLGGISVAFDGGNIRYMVQALIKEFKPINLK